MNKDIVNYCKRLQTAGIALICGQPWKKYLPRNPMEIYPARIPKAPDFWHPQMWSRPRLITNNQTVTNDALEIIGEMLRFTQGGRFL
ncbi:molybdate metabolism regulator MolR-like protein [Escherichia coli]|uniref:Molybdate metabolism regulator MolR-like protein n=1 Tax=Escherichia coli TaxID=562 RepID=A0A2X1MUQ0_ECOLX|nr:molybdate metabolism regulator MolR-like protein [Escherichia coli]